MSLRRIFQYIAPIFGILLFVASLMLIHDQIGSHRYGELLKYVKQVPLNNIFYAVIFTLMSYIALAGVELLSVKHVGESVSFGRAFLASFLGNSVSNNAGLSSLLLATSIKYRIYTSLGINLNNFAKIVMVNSITFWLGFAAVAGVIFTAYPMVLPDAVHIPFVSLRVLGIILIFIAVAYITVCKFKKEPVNIGFLSFKFPGTIFGFQQMTLSSLDWIISGMVLFVLLPPAQHIDFLSFSGVFMLAQALGIISQIPGGLGVFDSVIITLLSPSLPPAVTLGSLVVFRGVYYLLPLVVSAALLGVGELIQKKEKIKSAGERIGKLLPGIIPPVLALSIFVTGAVMLFSGALPIEKWRIGLLNRYIPLPVLEFSHFSGSIIGAALILLAQSIQKRLDAAYVLTMIMLSAGAVLCILKGFNYELALILVILMLSFIPCRKYFYRKASLLSQSFTSGWIAAIVVIILCTLWLGIFTYRHVQYSDNLWWMFTVKSEASRFLRASAGTVSLLLIFSIASLLSPAASKPASPSKEDMEAVKEILKKHGRVTANVALLGDKQFLFNDKRNAFIMYGIQGKSWIALGDPIGPSEEYEDLIWKFRELSDKYGWTVFTEVGKETLFLYLDMGLTPVKIGEEGRVSLIDFSLEGGKHRKQRSLYNKLQKEGFSFEVIPQEQIKSLLPELKKISDTWLIEKNTREKGFSLGYFNEEYLGNFPAGVIKSGEKIIAFANIWSDGKNEELSIDLMRYLPESPSGIMDFLFISLMLWGKNNGYKCFNMGMAALSGLENRALSPLWNKIGTLIYKYGEDFYNFQGLRQYKDKYDPEWQPRYILSPAGFALPVVLKDLASLSSGGITGIISK